MGQFHFVQFNLAGELLKRGVVSYTQMAANPTDAVVMGMASRLLRQGSKFSAAVPGVTAGTTFDYWTECDSAAHVMISAPDDPTLMLHGVLASGINAQDDERCIQATQRTIVSVLRDSPNEPAFDLTAERDRPLAAAMLQWTPARRDEVQAFNWIFGAFAAAFFRLRGVI